MIDKNSVEPTSIKTDNQIPANSLIDFLTIVTKYRKFISRFVLFCTVGTIIIALLLPKW